MKKKQKKKKKKKQWHRQNGIPCTYTQDKSEKKSPYQCFQNKGYSKRKGFARRRSESFPLRVVPVFEVMHYFH